MPLDPPKRIKRLLRIHAAAAHEEELRRALQPVAGAFKRWEDGKLRSRALSEVIRTFEQGPVRDLYVRYNSGVPEASVAYAIAAGVLQRGAVDPELLEYLAAGIRFYERPPPGRTDLGDEASHVAARLVASRNTLTDPGRRPTVSLWALHRSFLDLLKERTGGEPNIPDSPVGFVFQYEGERQQAEKCWMNLHSALRELRKEDFSTDAILWTLAGFASEILPRSRFSKGQIDAYLDWMGAAVESASADRSAMQSVVKNGGAV